ncbi:MAG: Endoglucanase H precursor [Bacteroidetes bacterium ADurb.Bin217]|nr:MAG: Endoglucanase H precursor [Bacteroidetes bacterium ADurb.Bin217]
MKVMYRKIYVTIFTSILYVGLFAQNTPFEVLPYIMRGINLGNTFETDSIEGHWKEEDPVEWKDNGPAQEYYFDAYKQAGFTCVRIPVTWHTRTLSEIPYTIDENWLLRVEEVVDWAIERNMYVILNAHHETWLKENYDNALYRERFDSIWSQIATHFKDKSELLLFEIINEPLGMTVSEVDDLNARILQIMRKSNPTRIVLFSGNKWANVDELRAAAIPQDSYIMGYYHSYEPWSFAGEGNGTWGTTTDISAMISRIAKGKDWVNQHNIPLIISEFGTDTLCDYNSRMLFYAYYVEEAYKQNIACAVWDDGGTFNVYRRNQQTWHDTKEILIYYSQWCPTQLQLTMQSNGVGVEWTNRIIADSIHIERRLSNTEFEKIARVSGSEHSFVDSNTIPEDFHYYRIKAYKNDSLYYSYPQLILVTPDESLRQPYLGEAFTIPCTIQAEQFDNGGYGLTYFDQNFIQSHSNYRSEKGVDIIETSNQSFALIDNEKGEWFEYSVLVPVTAEYEITVFVGAISSGSFSLSCNGITKTKSCTLSGSYSVLLPHIVSMQLPEGNQILRLNITKTGDFAIDSITIVPIYTHISDTYAPQNIQIIEQANNVFTIVSNNASVELQSISVYSLLGVCVMQKHIDKYDNSFSLSQLPKGMYMVNCGGSSCPVIVR